jgi:hypothetical protein
LGTAIAALALLAFAPSLALAQQPTLSGTTLVGQFTTSGFVCFPTQFGYQSAGAVTPPTSPYYPGTFTQQGAVVTQGGSASFSARFSIATATGTTIAGTASGPLGGGCNAVGATNLFSSGGGPSARYAATITTASGRRFTDAGAAFASFAGQAPGRQNLTGESRLGFFSALTAAVPRANCDRPVAGTAGGDAPRLTQGDDAFDGMAGSDTLIGQGGHDCLLGSAGSDNLLGGAGNDTLAGGTGNDNLLGDAGADDLTGGTGSDNVSAGTGDDLVDVFDGQAGDDVSCGDGIDTVYADPGDRVALDCERVIRAARPVT